MTIIRIRTPLTWNRAAAAALAALGAGSAIPIALAQLDFAGRINTFNIDGGDSPRGEGPCAILMIGARPEIENLRYPVSEVAAR